MKSIQTKLTVFILSIVLVSMGILGGVNYWKARQIITGDILKSVQEKTLGTAVEIETWLNGCKLEMAGIALSPVIQSGKVEEIIAFLADVHKKNDRYESFAFVQPNGDSYNNMGTLINLSHRPYIQKALQGEAAVSDPVRSPATGKMSINVAVPVTTNAGVAGALFGSISIEDIAEKVLAIKVGKTGYAYVQQSDGLIIIHPGAEVAMKGNYVTDDKLPAALRETAARQVKGETGLTNYEFAGVDQVVAFAPIKGTGWSLALTVPMLEVAEDLAILTKLSSAVIIVVLIAAGLFIAWLARRIAKPIQVLAAAANRIAAGDLSETSIPIDTNDEIGRLGHSFEQMARNLRVLIQQVQDATAQVSASSQQLTASAEQSAQAANQIAASIVDVAQGASEQMAVADNTTAIVEQMSAGMQQMAANSGTVAGHTAAATDKARNGNEIAMQAVRQMDSIEVTVTKSGQLVAKLGERSKEIGQIVDTISSIAGQTNLLALNAAIEAARAGEQGRGFAVVAEEVRKLAEQSQDAAKKIAGLIGEIQTDTDQAVTAMDNGTREVKLGTEVVSHAGEAFREIAGLVEGVSLQVREFSASVQQMASESRQVVSSITAMAALSQKSASESQGVSAAAEEQLASMEEISSSSQALANLAQDLQTTVNDFRL